MVRVRDRVMARVRVKGQGERLGLRIKAKG